MVTCHSERSEESFSFPAQDKLREAFLPFGREKQC